MKEDIKKIIFLALEKLPENKGVLYPDLYVLFLNKTGKELSKFLEEFKIAIEQLEENRFVRYEPHPHHPVIFRGLDFDKWNREMNNEPKQPQFGSVTVHAQHVQVGNENLQTINITINQLVQEIAKSSDTEAKGLLKQLLENSTAANIIGAGASALFAAL